MAAHAQPLWQALPDGVLKRQLLGELAELAEIDTRDLADLWARTTAHAGARNTSTAPSHQPSHTTSAGNTRPAQPRRVAGVQRSAHTPAAWATPAVVRGRQAPVSRADQAARLLLAHMPFLEELSHDDHDALCTQPAPHGPLFAWLEAQFMEQGPLAWAVLRESLRDHECEELAVKVMTGSHAQTEGDLHELRLELRDLLNRMLIEDINAQQKALILQAAQDPTALERYRALEQRRNILQGIAPRSA